MTIELPHRLRWVHELCGSAWPAADEDHFFDLARRFQGAAIELQDLDRDVDSVARDVVESNDAPSIDGFRATWRTSHYNHQRLAEAIKLVGHMAASSGLAIQAAKITLLGILGLTATRILRAKTVAQFLPGTAADEAFRAEAAGRAAIATTLRRLRVHIEMAVAMRLPGAIEEILAQIGPSGAAPTAAGSASPSGEREAPRGYDALARPTGADSTTT